MVELHPYYAPPARTPQGFSNICPAHELLRDSVTTGVLSLEQLNPAATAATKDKIMKMQSKLVTVTVIAIAAMFVIQARAQSRSVGDDGIAASPKLRQQLNERGTQPFQVAPVK